MNQSLKILAIDTSLYACSVALLSENKIQENFIAKPQQQAEMLLPMIEQLLKQSTIKLSDLQALAFSTGPGSFTGMRVSAATIQGLAYASNLPVIKISTLQVLAQQAWRQFACKNALVCVDAQMQQLYWGIYQLDKSELMQPLQPDLLTFPTNVVIPKEQYWMGVGGGWIIYEKPLREYCGEILQEIITDMQPHAQDIAKLAAFAYRQGKLVTAEEALPSYLRGSEYWKKS